MERRIGSKSTARFPEDAGHNELKLEKDEQVRNEYRWINKQIEGAFLRSRLKILDIGEWLMG
jgi:hypothetical protein